MRYIYFTYDALSQIMQDRRFLSNDFPEGDALCRIVTGMADTWTHPYLHIYKNEKKDGYIFYTKHIDRRRGFLFDLTTFKGFEQEKDDLKRISLIIIKSLRYGVKYFDGTTYLSQNEVLKRESNILLLYPYPYTRSKEVPKVVIDLNNSSEAKRKELRILTAYSYQTVEDNVSVGSNTLMRVLNDLKEIDDPSLKSSVINQNDFDFKVSKLDEDINLSLESNIGFDHWTQFLTNAQKDFIYGEFKGPERLEGPAGSGKTLSLCLRIIHLLRKAKEEGESLNIIYFTHSEATKEQIIDCLKNNCLEYNEYDELNNGKGVRSVKVITLQDWCAHHLGINDLSDNEYLDKDAGNSKILQSLYIEESWKKYWANFGNLAKNKISKKFAEFIDKTPEGVIYEVLQREFSEIIKGQSRSVLEKYLVLERPKYGMPLESEFDKRVVFDVFKSYQSRLIGEGQFDSDDIVLSAMGQVDAPIWTRRRIKEGYDICFIDETHLFNLNEISIFHFINKPEKRNNIVFCIDKSQSIGDSYRADADLIMTENGSLNNCSTSRYDTLFRCSHDVAALALSILSSGAALFTTLENPLIDYTILSIDSRQKEMKPFIKLLSDMESMIVDVFEWVREYVNKTKIKRSKVLIVGVNNEVTTALVSYARKTNKSFIELNGRGDNANIKKAINDSRFVIAGIDYIGGLEFDAVAIVGTDGNRVPPVTDLGRHIINFAWYNRLYVAVTRARYAVAMFGEQAGRISPLLEYAINDQTLIEKNSIGALLSRNV